MSKSIAEASHLKTRKATRIPIHIIHINETEIPTATPTEFRGVFCSPAFSFSLVSSTTVVSIGTVVGLMDSMK